MDDTDHSISQQTPIALPTSQGAFDYGALDAEKAQVLRNAAGAIRNIQHAAFADVGRHLIEARGLLEHGQFQTWVTTELRMKVRTAQRAMGVAKFLEGKSVTLTLLPQATIYRLSAPSAPPAVVEAVVEAAEAGTLMPVQEINDRLDRAREEEKEIQREIDNAKLKEERPLTRQEAKDRAAKRKADRLATEERRKATAEKGRRLVEAHERKLADRIERMNPVLQSIAKKLTDETLVDIMEMLKDPYRFSRSLTPILHAEHRSRIAPNDSPIVPTEADHPEVDISESRA